MEIFIDTSKIIDEEELIKALKSNCKTASILRKEINKIEKENE